MAQQQIAASIFDINLQPRSAVPVSLAILVAMLTIVPIVQAQTFTVLHTFTGTDGSEPFAGLTRDRAGNLYGTTNVGGTGNGTVFKLSHVGSGWLLSNLYTFQGGNDGAVPQARVVFGPDGTLYGTTTNGGGHDAGTVFNLRPPATVCRSTQCSWTETVLYRFTGGSDGAYPYYADLTFDSGGNIYGTTASGGRGCTPNGCGVVFKLSHSGGGWTESVLYALDGGDDGTSVYSGVIFDAVGNLYGTTFQSGANGGGTVYKLAPSDGGWSESTLYNFGESGTGANPFGGLIFDTQGNLYGTTSDGGGNDGSGTVFELQPSGGNWTYQVLAYAGDGPTDTPTMDTSGNLYGTVGLDNFGNVFKLTPGRDGWTYTDLFDFSAGNFADGFSPVGGVVLDADGNIYGTTALGGSESCGEGCGIVWEITP